MLASIEIKEEVVSDHSVESPVPETETTKEILKDKKGYACKFCSKVFSRNGNLTNHLLIHTDEKPFICSVCNKAFNQKRQLSNHLRTHTSGNLYTCVVEKDVVDDHCAESTAPDTNAKNGTLTEKKGCKCKFCGKVFSEKCHLKSHLLIHSEDKPFSCNVCDETFNQECLLNLHIFTHTNQANVKEKQMVTDNGVLSSVPDTTAQIETVMDKKGYTCKFCGKIFSKNCSLKSHLFTRDGGKKPISCHVCKETFIQKCQLNLHILTHRNKKLNSSKDKKHAVNDHVEVSAPATKLQIDTLPVRKVLTCKYCGKVFSKKCNLRSHLLVHTGEKPFKCNACDKAFNQSCHLILHLRTHTNEKPYSCDVCGKTFSQKSHINKHALTHTKEKPYSCNICYKDFSRKDHLNCHIQIHTIRESYYCDICDKKYSNKCSLNIHLRTHVDKTSET